VKRKPTELHRLAGTFRADRHGRRLEAGGEADGLRKPGWLRGNGARIFYAIVNSLVRPALAASDVLVIAGAARWWALWHGTMTKLEAGEGDAYKLTLLASIQWKAFEKTAAKLGLSPIDRARLTLDVGVPASAEPELRSKIVG
jgi:hypothetical protein